MIINLTAANKVRAAIEAGARTQEEIRRKTKLAEDHVCDALAYLLLTVHAIRTASVGNTRFYFPIPQWSGEASESALSFSTMRGLMPRMRTFRC